MENVKLSVAMPLFRSKEIAWLALEGLCRQKGIFFKWELLVAEETAEEWEPFGYKAILEYKERLEAVGCDRIVYIPTGRVTLPEKWYLLSRQVSESSIGFLLQPGDNFASPHCLKDTYTALQDGADWVHYRKGLFYDLISKEWAVFDKNERITYHPCGVNHGINSRLLRGIYPEQRLRSGVDSWLYNCVNPYKVVCIDDDSWREGIILNGINNISTNRSNQVAGKLGSYIDVDDPNFKDKLPADILEKLEVLAESSYVKERNLVDGITVGIVVTRPEMVKRAIHSVNQQQCCLQVDLVTVNNKDRKRSIGACYNEIVSRSNTLLVAFLGDDDLLMPDYLTALLGARALYRDKTETYPVVSASLVTLCDGSRFEKYDALSPGLWERSYLVEHPFDEEMEKYVTASYYEEANKRGIEPSLAHWNYSYYYYQHSGNVSGNKFEQFEKE